MRRRHIPPPAERFGIGALSKRTGVNIETIRYYERIGMVPKPPRSEGGHRVYDQNHLKRLAFVRRTRELGFSLEEIRALLELVDGGDYTCAEVKAMTLAHADVIRQKIADLRRMERVLKGMAAQCDGGDVPECPIVDALSS
ncbi:MAG: helix-turn-helix domain-containing protein [Rhodospirillales bacterium]|nr:helix-turn-helix domain-containing protein [Rhodospirillales bacterium]MBI2586708.1 helix-turn-helix domain-containing protein [Rhodospirillales bacterium]MBI2977354.1 helix-turn-helix domain-containing protein [Rhodospirillales bacterium]MBI3113519.1 helix-turn-helix domain-containing protein [Rhodospirillales bacterium]